MQQVGLIVPQDHLPVNADIVLIRPHDHEFRTFW
jgi:hypothetical protein